MEISKDQLFLAASEIGIPVNQVEALWTSLETKEENPKASSFTKLFYYFGALIIISAMTWLLGLSWEWFGGGAILIIAVIYAVIFSFMGTKLWKREDFKIPAGLFITIAVCMTPLAIYGLETYLNVWPGDEPENYKNFYHMIRGSWVFMEIGTIVAGVIALRFFPFPFITAPIFLAAWFLTMDIIPLLFGNVGTWKQKEWVSLCLGFAMVCIAYNIDRKKMKDYGFWGYFFGTITFWISLTGIVWDEGEFVFFIYFMINILLMVFSVVLDRKVLMVCGAIGASLYFSHLAYEFFKNSIAFPFILSFIGLSIIFLGVVYQKNYRWIERKINDMLPAWIKKL